MTSLQLLTNPLAADPRKLATKATPNDVLSFMQDMYRKEERARDMFARKYNRRVSCKPSVEVDKLIERVRRATEQLINRRGGKASTLTKQTFCRYDPNCKGIISASNVPDALNELHCPYTTQEVASLIQFFDNGHGDMDYIRLAEEIGRRSRHFLDYPTSRSDPMLLSPASDPKVYHPKPRGAAINTYCKKLKILLLKKVTRSGGTEKEELENVFNRLDDKRRKVIDFPAFREAMRILGLKMSAIEAQEVFDHFAEECYGGIRYKEFVKDVLKDINHWFEMPTDDQIKKVQLGVAADWAPSTDSYRSDLYRFTTRLTHKPKNALVEKFLLRLNYTLEKKIVKSGDVIYFILMRTFLLWDASSKGKVDMEGFKGVMARVGYNVQEDEAKEVMSHYDLDGSGLLAYRELVKDICKLDRSWMSHSDTLLVPIHDFTARVTVPPILTKLQSKIREASEVWAIKIRASASSSTSTNSQCQSATAKEAFHGICLRFDKTCSGRLSLHDFDKVVKELGLVLDHRQTRRLVSWYSCEGGREVDYNHLIKDAFPKEGVSTTSKVEPLPSITTRHREIVAEKKKLKLAMKDILAKERALNKERVGNHKKNRK